MNATTERWLRAVWIGLFVFIMFSLYLFLRRGYYNLYIINKVFGSTAIVVAGISLLAGPMRRMRYVSHLMSIRRQLGLLAFGLVLLHVLASLLQTKRFPLFAWYIDAWIPISFGLLAVGVWLYMTYISRNSKIKELGSDVWKKRLSIAGKVAFMAIFLHLVIMKYPGWIKWLNGNVKQTPELANPTYPPASIFVFIFMVTVILYRIIAAVLAKRSQAGESPTPAVEVPLTHYMPQEQVPASPEGTSVL